MRNDRIPEISLIMPVYNVGPYVEKALESLLAQDFTDWECIVVDDGSTDDSGRICDSFEKRDSRYKVVHSQNGGVSKARNKGLELANGKYIGFVDADDWVEKDYLKILHGLIEEYGADVAQCGFVKEFVSFARKKPLVDGIKIFEGTQIKEELRDDRRVPSYLWNKLFRRDVIVGDFTEGRVYEDYDALTSWSPEISKIVASPSLLYHYRMRRGSINTFQSIENQMDFLWAIRRRGEMLFDNTPDVSKAEQRNVFFYRNYVERAKVISRMNVDRQRILEAVRYIGATLQDIPEPCVENVSTKIMKRAKCLKDNPDKFVNRMRRLKLLDFHSGYCRAKSYE